MTRWEITKEGVTVGELTSFLQSIPKETKISICFSNSFYGEPQEPTCISYEKNIEGESFLVIAKDEQNEQDNL